MAYDPSIHQRRSIRLKDYDYSQAGLYFITICCLDKKCWFGEIAADSMNLNEYGTIASAGWHQLPERFPNVELDAFQIMPNHIHAILILEDKNPPVGAGLAPAHPGGTQPATVGDIVRTYKSLVARACLDLFKAENRKMGKLWQRNYYEHIIRNAGSHNRIAGYIADNPSRWQDDRFYMP